MDKEIIGRLILLSITAFLVVFIIITLTIDLNTLTRDEYYNRPFANEDYEFMCYDSKGDMMYSRLEIFCRGNITLNENYYYSGHLVSIR